MSQLYKNIGITRQAVDQHCKREDIFNQRIMALLTEAEDLRKEHPGCGLEKMYFTLNPDFIGRDRFIELFTGLGFKRNKKINYKRTTYSVTSKYKNLIKGLYIDSPCIVWQTDITYYEVNNRFYYTVFIIDVYTKIIVGYKVSDNMRALANIEAITMAIQKYNSPKIHHSDRGSQYIYHGYIRILQDYKCQISMCKTSQDNAYAERINKTIKEEYLDYWKPSTFSDLKRFTAKAVEHYNHKRLHKHLDRMAPIQFYNQVKKQTKKERKIMQIFNNEIL